MKQTMKANLLYVNEHLTCGKYLKEIDTGFFFQEIKKGSTRKLERETMKNYLVIILEGKIRLNYNLSENRIISGGEFFLIAQASLVSGECLEDVQILTLAFEAPTTSCEKLNFQLLTELADSMDYNFEPLPIRYPFDVFCELTVCYLKYKANCGHLHEAKHNELFLCLRYFYSKEELAGLFYPILSQSFEFKRFVLENYGNVKSAKELKELSCMSKSAFYAKFREVFGITTKQWLTIKKLTRMINKAAEPGITVKQLMIEFDFDNLSHLQAYCKHNFKCTPTVLIEKAVAGEISIGKDMIMDEKQGKYTI